MAPKKAILLIAGLLFLFTLLASRGLYTMSATVDEPQHSVAAGLIRFRSDYRLDREDPPLWFHYVALFLSPSDIPAEFTPADFARMHYGAENPTWYTQDVVYTHPGPAGPEGIVYKARRPMVLVAIALGLSLAYIAWQITPRPFNTLAAVVTTAAFSLEPLILGHAVLVKNDIACALTFLWTAYFLHRALTHLTPLALLGLAVSLAAALTTKFSGPLLFPILAIAFLGRVFVPSPWPVFRSLITTRPQRLLTTAALILTLTLTSTLGIWAAYGFRFSPTPNNDHYDFNALVQKTAAASLLAQASVLRPDEDPNPTREEIAAWRPDILTRFTLWTYAHQLLPESYLAGFLYTYQSTLYRSAFLLGHTSDTGFHTYFPIAFAAKTPLTLLALYAAAALLMLKQQRWQRYWFLILPIVLYSASAIAGHLDIGLRHLLPIYPFLLLALGPLTAHLTHRFSLRTAYGLLCTGYVLLALEVLPQTGHHLAYFNAPTAALTRHGLDILSDSNLDWGQDLKALVAWQHDHPTTPLSLAYFGAADPRALGLHYTNTPISWAPGAPEPLPSGGIIAISATHLQGTHLLHSGRNWVAPYRTQTPVATLNNTVYLFKIP